MMRGIVDREFCSQVHRRLASKSPDRIAKDIDVTSDYGLAEMWTIEKETRRQAKGGHQAVGVFALLGIATLAAVGLATGGSSGANAVPQSVTSLSPTANPSSWGDSMRSIWKSHAQVTLTHDFSEGLGDFVGGRGAANAKRDWSLDPSGLRPGRLKVWQRSTALSDYDMEFLGQIEQKSLGWAFRAPDLQNYYASKLVLNGKSSANGGPNAGFVRFVMLDGREQDRAQMALPLSLERGVPYRIHLSVMGSRFVTTVNGQVVSSWSDSRLHRGGVGFFSEEGELATVRWVSVSERDSILGRLLSHFSLIQSPWPRMLYDGPAF